MMMMMMLMMVWAADVGLWLMLTQSDNETVLELVFERVFPQMFRDYTFVASNHVGTTRHTITLVRGQTLNTIVILRLRRVYK